MSKTPRTDEFWQDGPHHEEDWHRFAKKLEQQLTEEQAELAGLKREVADAVWYENGIIYAYRLLDIANHLEALGITPDLLDKEAELAERSRKWSGSRIHEQARIHELEQQLAEVLRCDCCKCNEPSTSMK